MPKAALTQSLKSLAVGGLITRGAPIMLGEAAPETVLPLMGIPQTPPMAPQLTNGAPLLIHPDAAAHAVREVLQGQQPGQRAYFDWGTPWHADAAGIEPHYDVKDGVAIIRIASSLWHAGYAWSGHSYAGIRLQLAHAIDAASVKGVLLDINSPGGDVAGLFDLVDDIEAMRASKPIWALSNEGAFSAAYGIAASAERIITPRTGQLGSIGVITTHWDYSEELNRWGIQVTPIYAGDGKTDGAYFQPLSDEARARFQAEVDKTYKLFTATVARLRTGDAANAADVVALGAHTFTGQDAVDAGLADDVMSAHDALAALIEHVADTKPSSPAAGAGAPEKAQGATTPEGETDMSLRDKALARKAEADAAKGQKASDEEDPKAENEDDPKAEGEEDDPKDEGEEDDPKAEEDDPKAKGEEDDPKAEGEEDDPKAEEDDPDDAASSAKSERKRIQAITDAPEAAGREAMAKHLAYETEMSAMDAIAMLATAPKGSNLDSKMQSQKVPDTGAYGGGTGEAAAAGGLLKARAEKRAADAKDARKAAGRR